MTEINYASVYSKETLAYNIEYQLLNKKKKEDSSYDIIMKILKNSEVNLKNK